MKSVWPNKRNSLRVRKRKRERDPIPWRFNALLIVEHFSDAHTTTILP